MLYKTLLISESVVKYTKKQFSYQCVRSVLEAIYKVVLNTVNCIVVLMYIKRISLYRMSVTVLYSFNML
jgi:hypothetical protein